VRIWAALPGNRAQAAPPAPGADVRVPRARNHAARPDSVWSLDLDGRPFPGARGYRGHLQGLYLCGSSCHPGGNITGLPGYNAAQVILRDLDLTLDLFPTPFDSQLEALAA
jgi:hypothetical protein